MLKKRSVGYFLLVMLLSVSVVPAWAYRQSSDSIRCKTRLISIGAAKFDVLRNCGEPAWVEVREEERIVRDYYDPYLFGRESLRYRTPLFTKEKVIIEEWTYNFGSSRFIRYLTFENGKLVSIESGGYGY